MMRTRDFLRWYIRSPLGIAALLASIALGLLLGVTGWRASSAAGVALAVFLVVSLVAFFSGAGARAAVRERERDASAALNASLAAAAKLRDRISALRIPDPEIQKASSGFSFAFGEYLDACRREGTRDPAADSAAEEVLAALTVYLEEMNGTSVERRFDLPDADPFPDAKGRTLVYLSERTAYVRDRRMAVDGGLGGSDRLSIREELK
jgi:hypothetical protein